MDIQNIRVLTEEFKGEVGASDPVTHKVFIFEKNSLKQAIIIVPLDFSNAIINMDKKKSKYK